MLDPGRFHTHENLRDGQETWLCGDTIMKSTIRTAATNAGQIERNLPSKRKSGRQATFSSDILYDTLHRYDLNHFLLRITRIEAGRGLVDLSRIEAC